MNEVDSIFVCAYMFPWLLSMFCDSLSKDLYIYIWQDVQTEKPTMFYKTNFNQILLIKLEKQ